MKVIFKRGRGGVHLTFFEKLDLEKAIEPLNYPSEPTFWRQNYGRQKWNNHNLYQDLSVEHPQSWFKAIVWRPYLGVAPYRHHWGSLTAPSLSQNHVFQKIGWDPSLKILFAFLMPKVIAVVDTVGHNSVLNNFIIVINTIPCQGIFVWLQFQIIRVFKYNFFF